MAEEIVIDFKIKTAESAATVQELKKSLKELKNELNNVEAGSAQFNKLTKSINNTEGKLGDLNDSFNTLTGSGVERANKSFKLFTEGLTNFDLGKIKASLGGLGAAFKAIPIFLIVEGVMYLIQNFKELSSGSGILAKALKPIGDLIGWIKDGLYALTDAIGLTNSELDKMGESVVENATKANEALGQQTKEFDRQMQVAKAAGKSTVEMEKAKQQAIIDTNVQIVKQIEAFVRAGGEMTEEQTKQLTASLEVIKDARTQQTVIELNHQKEDRDNYKKHLEDKAKLNKEHDEELLRQHQAEVAKFEQARKDEAEREKQAKIDEINALNQSVLEAEAEYQNDSYTQEQNAKQAKDIADVKRNEQNLENEKAFKKQSLAVTVQALQATQGLTDLYFKWQLKQAKGNADREKEIKKKQFQLNKAFAVAQIVLNTIQSITQAIGSNPPPLSWVLAGINSAMGTAATIAALAQKFEDGGSSSANIGDIGGGGGGATASAPAIAQPNNSVTKISDEGKVIDKPMNQRVFVLETDITDSTKKITSIEESAKIH